MLEMLRDWDIFAIGCKSPFHDRLHACQAKSQFTPSRLLHNQIYVTVPVLALDSSAAPALAELRAIFLRQNVGRLLLAIRR
jgi:hypothetical protein